MALMDLFRRAPAPAPRIEPRIRIERAAPLRGGARGFLGAEPSRLLADLPQGAATAPSREIRQALPVLVARSRHLAQNDGYSIGFLKSLRRNVVGPHGFTLQMRVKTDRGDGPDKDANARLEGAHAEWAMACDVTGRLTWPDLQRLVITGVARDGEALVRKVRGARFNRHGFALQVLDPMLLDPNLNSMAGAGLAGYRLPASNTIRQGVELDGYERPVAYHLRTSLPGDDVWRMDQRLYVRVPAEEILHLFMQDWPGQVRGYPWLSGAIRSLAMLDGYTEAELAAARLAANKMGFYRMANGTTVDDLPADLQADGQLLEQSEPGSFTMLPPGLEVQAFDPQHPTAAFSEFVKAVLRSAAAGSGTSYSAFANDAEGMNYSALRATELEDRDEFRTLQNWMVGRFNQPVFVDWLRECLLSGATGLPAGKFWKFNAPQFVGRGWTWVDPAKEVRAAREAIAEGLKSRTQIVAEQGGDFNDTLEELKAEAAAMQALAPTTPKAGAGDAAAA